MSTNTYLDKNSKYIQQIQSLILDIKGNYYLKWSIPKELNNNFDVLQKLINAMLKDKSEGNSTKKGQPSNMHRYLAQCIIDEEYKHLTPEEREPDCYANIELEDAFILLKCWGFNFGNINPYSCAEEDTPLVCAFISAYYNTFLSMD